MRIAFYAPLKAPDHPVPSGDRQMARLLLAALRAAGHGIGVASTLRSGLAAPDPERMRGIADEAVREHDRLSRAWADDAAPDLWFTYHAYYKAPDLLGPGLAARWGLPYVAAEASHAAKRATGPWAAWHAANEAAVRMAALHVCFTPRDAEGLAGLVNASRIMMLPPFLAAGPFVARPCASGAGRAVPSGPVELVAVAMMRAGDKARSFAFLAETLAALPLGLDWRLTLVGDGPERAAVRAMLATVDPARLVWAGERDREGVAAILAASDVYVWPGFGEAYGIAYLEAAAAGLPVLAMDCGGVASVVDHGVTGLLTPEGDRKAFGDALARLIADPALRARLGEAGRRLVLETRTVDGAATRLSAALDDLVAGRR